MVRFLGTTKDAWEKEIREKNQIFGMESPSLWLICLQWFNSSYFCIVKI